MKVSIEGLSFTLSLSPLLVTSRSLFSLPNRNPEPCEKRHRLGNCVVDIRCPQGDSLADEDKAFSRPLLDESRSLFYISKEKQGRGGAGGGCGPHRVRGRLGGRSSFGLEEMGEAGDASERGLGD